MGISSPCVCGNSCGLSGCWRCSGHQVPLAEEVKSGVRQSVNPQSCLPLVGSSLKEGKSSVLEKSVSSYTENAPLLFPFESPHSQLCS